MVVFVVDAISVVIFRFEWSNVDDFVVDAISVVIFRFERSDHWIVSGCCCDCLIVFVVVDTSVVIFHIETSDMDDFDVHAISVPFSALSGQTAGSFPPVAVAVWLFSSLMRSLLSNSASSGQTTGSFPAVAAAV